MSISPDLFDSISPPGIWITISKPDCREAEEVLLTLRVQPAGRRSVSATVPITRYAPSSSIVRSAAAAVAALEMAQAAVTRADLQAILMESVRAWVEPF